MTLVQQPDRVVGEKIAIALIESASGEQTACANAWLRQFHQGLQQVEEQVC